MTRPDLGTSQHEEPVTQSGFAARSAIFALTVIALCLLVPFGAGVIAGYLDAGHGTHGPDAVLVAIVLVWLGVLAGLSLLAVKYRPFPPGGPVAASVKRSRRILVAAVALGAFIGVVAVAGDVMPAGLVSDAPVSVFAALVILAAWLIVTPIMTLLWWRSTDEHERAAYVDGANVAGHVYLFIAPAWWIATRAGLLPPQDPMIVLAVVMTIWTAVWLYRKYA
jgi:hypothetical protein